MKSLGGKVTGMRITVTRLPWSPRIFQKVSPCWLLMAMGRDSGSRRAAAMPEPTPAAMARTTATVAATTQRRRKSLRIRKNRSATTAAAISPTTHPLFAPKRKSARLASPAAKAGV